MTAYCMQECGKGELVELPLPQPGAGEVRIRTAFCGICGSDLHAYGGHHARRALPLIPGHETCGTIDARGDGVTAPELGTPVVVLPERGCGECEACHSGWPNLCASKTLLGTSKWPGGFAGYFCAPVDSLFELPAGVPIRLGALVEPLAVAVHAVRQAGFCKGQSMALIGAGGIGSLVLAVCRLKGASRAIVCDLKEFNLTEARRHGADIVLNTRKVEAPEQFEAAGITMVDTVFIAASDHDLINQSFRITRPRGVILLLGQFNRPGVVDIDKSRLKEHRIIGSFTYTSDDFAEAITLIAAHPEVFLPIISTEISLGQVDRTVRAMIAGTVDAVKIVAKIHEQT
ncbi:zinc-dependent alcohol dehydrogenase [Pseudohoeflea coraliihabitans]|uniref:Alcohol dehydrogenase catalytic domain-containing protein n=1 Tax=Pseudohoeflea coraliihabitans TaxID=2860393 RepID=A0ABS6WML8_9HYPH|nr:alcohol dehydrogenase catalytic domain-containing protein [Pseudohoeflea sp. DP4N28-3]MBW3097196.1 alcohol dehydrogenase catalytic domain-containing protein [Pseudohoeflea sp. DP4N28-3]